MILSHHILLICSYALIDSNVHWWIHFKNDRNHEKSLLLLNEIHLSIPSNICTSLLVLPANRGAIYEQLSRSAFLIKSLKRHFKLLKGFPLRDLEIYLRKGYIRRVALVFMLKRRCINTKIGKTILWIMMIDSLQPSHSSAVQQNKKSES